MGLVLSNATDNIINTDNTGGVTINSIISGTGNLTKAGSGTGVLTLKGVNTYSGKTTVTAGELRLNPSGNNSLSGACALNGGTLSTTGITSTRTITFSSIDILNNSTLALLSSTNHTITFTAKGTFTSGKTLTITGWTGNYVLGTAGAVTAAGKVFIGTSASLSASDLAQIRFYNGTNYYAATQLSTGEIVPTTSLVISTISNQTAGVGFSVTVSAKDLDGNLRSLPDATGITLTTATGGTIGGTTTGTISAVTSSVAISGVTLTAGLAQTITATRSSGDKPIDATSNAFDVTSSTPTITLSPTTLTGFTYVVGSGPSTEQSFNASGTSLTANITLNAPTNYEISTASGSGFSNTITLTHSGGTVSSTPIYVRLKAGLSVASYNSETITTTSAGSNNPTVACSGSVTALTPTITISTGTLSGFTYVLSYGPSAEQTYTVSGANLSADITITPATDYEISLTTNTGFGSTITLTRSGGSVSLTTIYVRLKAGLSAASYNSETISATSGSATGNVTCSGSVTAGSSTCFSENFVSASAGDNTSTTNQGSVWTANSNFTSISSVFQAGGAVKLGTSSSIGSLTSGSLSGVSGDVTVSFDVKGWTTAEGSINVTLNGSTQNVTYTAVMAGSFETKTLSFTSVPANSTLIIATSAKRAFIDNVTISCSAACTPPSNPSGLITGTTPACGSTTLSYSGTASNPIVNYWQTTATGVSKTNNASSTLAVSASASYFVRAYNAPTNCWSSSAFGPYAVVINTAPTISANPVASTISDGANTTFGVTASGTSITYQWQVDTGSGFSNLSNTTPYTNVTSPSMNITGATFGMNGYTYRCVVSGTSPCTAATSAPALLTVAPPVPEINIKQGTTNYLTTSTYAFGNVVQGANSQVTFTIENLGSANLTITSSTIGGAGFSMTTTPSSTVSGLSSTPLGITFTPTGIAAFSGSITIANNDSDEPSYVINFTGAGVPNNASDVSFNSTSGASTNSNIAYSSYQSPTIANTAGSIGVMGFYVRDGGAGLIDTDLLATELTGISFSVTNVSNIRSAALFNGNTLIATVPVNGVSPIVFTGLTVTCEDNKQLALNLRVTFNQTVTDNQQMIFTVSDVTANASGSSFAASNGGGAISSSSGDTNRIEVTADRLAFAQQPTTTSINTVMAPSVTVAAEDIYSNRDLDFATAVSVTSSGTLTGTVSDTAISGLATFSNLTHTVIGTLFTLTATSTGLVFSNTKVSSAFDITSIVYVNGDFQTTGSGTWLSNNSLPAIWEKFNGTAWIASNSPNHNTSAKVYIRNGHTITSGGSFGNSINLLIMDGGIFNSNQTGTSASLYIYGGGTLNINASLTNTGNFEIEDNGTVTINYLATNVSPIWNGTEIFHPNSNFIIYEWSANTSTTASRPIYSGTNISTNTYNGYTAAFGNLEVDLFLSSEANSLALISGGVTTNLAHKNLRLMYPVSTYNINVLGTGTATSGIGGDFYVDSLFDGTRSIVFNSSGNLTFVIGGNVNLWAATTSLTASVNATTTDVTVNGDIYVDASAVLNFGAGISANPTVNLNLKGDIQVLGSGLLQNLNTSKIGNFNFSGTGSGLTPPTTQTIDVASTSLVENSKLNFNIKSGAYVQLANRNFELGANSKLTVEDGGVLDFGFNVTTPLIVTKSGSQTGTAFESKSGSTLKITSPDGINNTSGTVGNVQITTAPIYSQTATFWYNGKTNQVTGTGLSNGSSAKIIYVNLIDNTKTLTLTNKIGISSAATLDALGGKLEIQKGTVVGSTNLDFYGTGRLVISDGEYKISTITTTPATDYLPQLSNYSKYSLTGGTVNLSGNSATENQILSGTPTYYNLAFNGSNILGTNYKGLSSATNVTNAITINETAVVDVKSFSLGGSPNTPSFTMTGTSSYITDGGGTKPDAGGTYALGATTTIEFANSSGAGIVRLGANYSKVIVSGNNVSNISEVTGIKFQSGGTFTVKNTGNFKFKNTAGFTGSTTTAINNSNSPAVTLDLNSTVEYAGADQTVTNFAPYYRNVTISGTGTKTNTNATFINEDLNVNGSKLLVNTDEVITVKQAVKIATVVTTEAAEIEIKNNSQLIQIDDIDANSGTNFKAERIASVNKYDYVYWSAPVDNFNVSNITGSYKYSWNPIFNNSNGTQGNWTTATGLMSKGKGYIVRAPNTSPVRPATATTLPISFLGKPNNGQFTFDIARGTYDGPAIDRELSNPNNELTTKFDDNWNLVGNPYPSAIDAEDFLLLNSSKIEGAVWIWKHGTAPSSSTDPFYQNYSTNYSSSDYLKYNGLGSSEPDTFNGKIASGQGFMVNMLESAGATNTVSFQNSLRAATHSNSNFYRNATTIEEKSRIWLNIVNTTSGKANTTLVGYSTHSTLGEDHLYDCVFIPEGELAIYSLLNTNPFVIQGRGLPFDSNDTVPLGMKIMANGNHKIAINKIDGLFETSSIGIYLEDKLLNSVHDLRQSPYTFTANIGRIDDRFVLRYSDQALGTPTFEAVANAVLVANKNNQINIQSSMESIGSVIVYDVLGRSLLEKSNIKNNTFVINNLALSNQTLIVKIVLENGQTVTKKIVF
jgi:hypothetical protein